MRLALRAGDDASRAWVAEGDPLPPEDRSCRRQSGGLERLYRDHAPRLLRFFTRKTDRDEASDLVHETFARLAGLGLPSVRAIDRPDAYLSRVATNLLRDRARRAARQSAPLHDSFEDGVISGCDPHVQLEDRDVVARLDLAVGRLNRRTREVFLLHRVDGLTYCEIADEMGMSPKGVKKQMAKALFELRREIGPL